MTSIQWTDVTWNPVRGCSRVSAGCMHCYAERVAGRFSGEGQAFHGFATGKSTDYHGQIGRARTNGAWRWTGKLELIPDKLDEPLHWRKPRRVFVNSMSDLFHENLPEESIDRVFAVMALAQQHAFQVLTKRPERMAAYMQSRSRSAIFWKAAVPEGWTLEYEGLSLVPFPLPNVWLGVSVEDQATADERIPLLLQTPAAVRFVSYEPALGPVRFDLLMVPDKAKRRDGPWTFAHDALSGRYHTSPYSYMDGPRLDWLIVGGESGPGARPFDVAWARSTVAQCREASVACFVKQLGARRGRCPRCGHDDELHGLGRTVGCQAGDGSEANPICGCRKMRGEIDHRMGDPYECHAPRDRKGGDPAEWPEDLRVRQFPNDAAVR